MRILFIATQSPAPPHGGAALRTLGLIRTVRRFAEVGLVSLARDRREADALRALGEEENLWLRTIFAPRGSAQRVRDAARSLLFGPPYVVQSARTRALSGAVAGALADFRPDVVQAELLASAPYLGAALAAGIPAVYSAHNVEARIPAGNPNARFDPWLRLMAAKTRREEAAWIRAADAAITVSEEEAAWIAPLARRSLLLPNALEIHDHPFVPPAQRSGHDLLFTGHLGYPPNRDAARRLARDVLPRVRESVPDARVVLAGARPVREVRDLAGPAVEVVADFENDAELFARAALFVCPLGWGAGSRLKLIEAAARGLPIVATPVSAEGLALRPERDFVAASTADGLARAVVTLLGAPEARAARAASARAAVEKHHDWSGLAEIMAAFYAGLAGHDGQE